MNYLRYAWVHVATALGLGVAAWALRQFAGINISSAGLGVLPPLVAAMEVGDAHARVSGRLPESGPAWRFAFIAMLISFGLSVVFTLLAGLALPEQVAAMKQEVAMALGTKGSILASIAAFLLAFFLVVTLLVNRYFLTFGAKIRLKNLKKAGR